MKIRKAKIPGEKTNSVKRAVILSCSWLLTAALHGSQPTAMTESDVIDIGCTLAKACLARFRGVAYTEQDAELKQLAQDLKCAHARLNVVFGCHWPAGLPQPDPGSGSWDNDAMWEGVE